jgi:predicted short-subunit dehydrogenase-like oxidoreductase (DUF2520 family)
MEKIRPTIGIIGAGVTGTALADRLFQQGYRITAVNSRTLASAQRLASSITGCAICNNPQQVADLAQAVFITTPDDKIADIAASLDWHAGQFVIHCSGVHSTDILEPAHKFGAYTCCLHPLQTFASIEEAIHNMHGSTFALEGDEQALAVAEEMAKVLQGNIIRLKASDKILYHAAAVTLSNYLVTLMKTAADLWQSFGVSQEDAVKAMLPLLKGTVNNIERVGIPGCLTGPIARGDIGTVQKHMQALEKGNPDALDTYRTLGLQTISIALAKGRISLETAEELRSALEGRQDFDADAYDEFYKMLGLDFSGQAVTHSDKTQPRTMERS